MVLATIIILTILQLYVTTKALSISAEKMAHTA